MKKIEVRVNEKCIGCGACVATTPEIFEFDEEGFSKIKVNKVEDKKLIEKVKEAAENCPVSAIEIKEIK